MNSTNANQPSRAAKKARKKTDTDQGYDRAVHAGQRRDEQHDVFERLTRTDVDVDVDITENLEPEELVAALEGKSADASADDIAQDLAIEASETQDENLAAVSPSEDDDDGSVSPEELGEQFLRGAAQQERRTQANDRESNHNIDSSNESTNQASLFDQNQDPLAEPRFPRRGSTQVNADRRTPKPKHT